MTSPYKQPQDKSLVNRQPTNLSVHNLCTTSQPPPGTTKLLGLGLKFCIASHKPTPDIKACMKQLAYRIRTKHFINNNPNRNETEYIPQIYVKLRNWSPPPASSNAEAQLELFEQAITEAIIHNEKITPTFSNLTPQQKETLHQLINNKDLIILPTDKNLGPAIINYEEYVKQILHEHLLSPNYERLSQSTASERLINTKNHLIKTFYKHKDLLSNAERLYFLRSFKNQHRTPIFYGLPKVHKKPIKLWPVVSCINSFPSIFSNLLDYKMKQLLHLVPSYIKDSRDLIQDIKNLKIPPGAKLFTADATAMYTHIDTNTRIQTFRNIFSTYKDRIPQNFPVEFLLTTLEIIMTNNIFTFGDTYWVQLQGTAMGTPAAPLYSILTFGYYENTKILPYFHNNLLYYRRYIDDIFGIWTDTNHPQTTHNWSNFKDQLNQYGYLRWNVENLTTTTTFLDLTITIEQNQLITSTYQKPMYLYIPPISAHPISCFKGLINGELIRYWYQNSRVEDFTLTTSLFIKRLLQRGHSIPELIPLLCNAASKIDNSFRLTPNNKTTNNNDENILYIHWRHHPHNINKSTIREIYNNTLKGNDSFNQMRLAVSRPKNLRDILCQTRLPDIEHKQVLDIINQIHLTQNRT
jgi:hypothetical protein